MSELEKLKFPQLEVGGSNYIVWALEASSYLGADGISHTVDESFGLPTGDTPDDKSKQRDASRAVCLLLRHIHKDLKYNYLEERNPAVIWKSLRLRFDTDRQQSMLPLLNDEWNKLCFYNYKSVTEYAAKLYSIASGLSWCGRKLSETEKIEKTLTTFNPAERILSTQHRRMNHASFDKLVAALILDEKHGLLLQKNHDERRTPAASTGAGSQLESHYNEVARRKPQQKGIGRHFKGKKNWKGGQKRKYAKRKNQGRRQLSPEQASKSSNQCHRCGLKGHWANKCRTSEFHCKLYQQSKDKPPEDRKCKKEKKDNKFMLSLSDDSEIESNCVEVYSGQVESDTKQCLIDSGTSHVILKDKSFFNLVNNSLATKRIKTLGGETALIQGTGQAELVLPRGTQLMVPNAIFAPSASRNLISFASLRHNGFHVTTDTTSSGVECLCLKDTSGNIVETFEENGNGLYCTSLRSKEDVYYRRDSMYAEDVDVQPTPSSQNCITLWHERLGHPGIRTLRKICNVVGGIPRMDNELSRATSLFCSSCAMGKHQNRKREHSSDKFMSHNLFETIVSDVCGPISPPSGPFHYFMIVKDMSSRYSDVKLLRTRNEVMPKLLASIIQLQAHFPNYPIKHLRVDNAGEYTSRSFQEFCITNGIKLDLSVPHAHNANAENFVKQIQLIARPMLLRSNLPLTCWGHAVLHAGDLIRLRPSSGNCVSPYEIVHGFAPTVKHIKVFASAVYVPIPPNQRHKLGPRRQLGIYFGYQSPSIVRYLSPQTGDLFTALISNCEFDETTFPKLGNDDDQRNSHEFNFHQPLNAPLYNDPFNGQGEKEVRRMLHLHRISRKAPDAFVPTERITRSELNEAANYPARVDIDPQPASTSEMPRKRGRPKGAKDLVPRKRRTKNEIIADTMDDASEDKTSEGISQTEDIPDVRAFLTSADVQTDPQTMAQCRASPNWPQWKAAIRSELTSLQTREVFGKVQECPPNFKPIGCKWVFTRKRDQTGSVARFKARLVAQGFTQVYGIDYYDTYSPVMTMTTFRWLLAFAARNALRVRQADIETAYLYGIIDTELYMKVPEGVRVEGAEALDHPCVRVRKSLYGLKQAGRIWYLHLSQYLLQCGFRTDDCCPCLFIKRSDAEIAIIGIYVDDIVMVGTDAALEAAMAALKAKFKVKDLGMLSLCLGLQVRQTTSDLLLHQATYIEKVLKRFSMGRATRIPDTPMVVRSLKPDSDIYGPRRDGEELLDEKYPYKEAVGALLYLANCSRPDIAFATSVLARFTSNPTKRHWSGIKQVLRYLAGTKTHGLLYRRSDTMRKGNTIITDDLCGFADSGYLSDPHKVKSQTGYVFLSAGGAISWKSTKQTLTATSTNQSELIALYETCRECVWLRRLVQFVRDGLRMPGGAVPTQIFEDNAACVAQVQQGYIKTDRTKHIDPKFFFMHELQRKELEVLQIASTKNPADLFTKSLGRIKHQTLLNLIGMKQF